jgi:kynurenine formamidase
MRYRQLHQVGWLVGVGLAALAWTMPAHAQQNCASKFGPGDQVGNLNYVTPEKTLGATKLVTRGKAYRLGIETNKNTPAYPPRTFSLTVLQPGQAGGTTLGPNKLSGNDDIITGWVGVGSQLDGLAHIGIDNVYYNCLKGGEIAQADGMTKLGIEQVPAIATRGVLLDMAGFLGTDPVKEGTAFNRPEIEGAMKKQGVTSIERGDVVLFYTGWTKLIGKDNKRYNGGEPGLGVEGAKYLASLGVAMIGADTWGLEVVPFEKGAGVFEVHQILLPMNGTYILENMNTAPLAADKAYEFMFVLGHPLFKGAVQSMINPVAIR